MSKIKMLIGAVLLATPLPASAATIDLSATDFDKSAVTYSFDPGSYTVSLAKGLFTAWAPVSASSTLRWVDYYKYSFDGVTKSTYMPGPRHATEDAAFAAYSAVGPVKLDFSKKTDVTFAIEDHAWQFYDNAGGITLNVAAVPEPATWGMMVLGFLGMGVALRTRRNRKAVVA
ncbi:PEP-CTERM sorting domain-containing protein [Sphingomonas sp. Tas61C01]|uniref:PEP-CTERM sorting domain-containing protein n=1 Tax=Sphingomonas sp. Tas61C01 TaxID=3458297 RepID=UPI00403E9903